MKDKYVIGIDEGNGVSNGALVVCSHSEKEIKVIRVMKLYPRFNWWNTLRLKFLIWRLRFFKNVTVIIERP